MSDHGLCCNPSEKADLEAKNVALVADYVAEFYVRNEGRSPYQLSILTELHQLTIQGIYRGAGRVRGVFFDEKIDIVGASFKPCPAYQIDYRLRDLLTRAADWRSQSGLQGNTQDLWLARTSFAADCFHELNSVHPVAGGNGRVSRAFLHLMLYEMGVLHPAESTLFNYFSFRCEEYLTALQEADNGKPTRFRRFLQRGVLNCRDERIVQVIINSSLSAFIHSQMHQGTRSFFSETYRASLSDAEIARLSADFHAELGRLLDLLQLEADDLSTDAIL